MSQDIVTLRRQLKLVGSTLRQNKITSAVQYVVSALRLMLTTPLMKAEKSEFSDLILEALGYLNNDRELRTLYPLALAYQPGEEKKLLEELTDLLEVLNERRVSETDDLVKSLAAQKRRALDQGQEYLDARNFDEARAVFSAISSEYPNDSALKGAIGEKALNAGLYEDAALYLSQAVDLDPTALHLYNRLAIALRKLGRFDVAESYYQKALPLAPEDPYLQFNVGRLYAEWAKWDKALKYGEKALALLPEFEEARKLVAFSRKKLA